MSVSAPKLNSLLWIGVGGALGALSRYFLSIIFYEEGFPLATLLVNLLGCFLLSYLSTNVVIKQQLPANLVLMINSGFIGSFTTFSTFAVEAIELWKFGYIPLLVYLFSTIIGGLLFVYLGFLMALKRKETVK